jgi:hypothetical protein
MRPVPGKLPEVTEVEIGIDDLETPLSSHTDQTLQILPEMLVYTRP